MIGYWPGTVDTSRVISVYVIEENYAYLFDAEDIGIAQDLAKAHGFEVVVSECESHHQAVSNFTDNLRDVGINVCDYRRR